MSRDVRAHDLVDERDVLAGLLIHGHGFDPANNTTELTSTPSLLLVRVAEVGAVCDRFTVSDAGFAGGAFNVVLAAHTLYVDLKMKLAHSGDDSLAHRQRVVMKPDRINLPLCSLCRCGHGT